MRRRRTYVTSQEYDGTSQRARDFREIKVAPRIVYSSLTVFCRGLFYCCGGTYDTFNQTMAALKIKKQSLLNINIGGNYYEIRKRGF